MTVSIAFGAGADTTTFRDPSWMRGSVFMDETESKHRNTN